jgi:peptide/nickel transport system substrate-binding protein
MAGRLLAPLVLLALLAACGGGGTPTSERQGSDGKSQRSGQPTNLDRDGRIDVAYDLIATVRGGKFTLDPAAVGTNLTDDALFYLLYGRLMRPTATGDLVPDLAKSATIIDPSTIEVRLRPDLTFSDGTPFDADAVKAGLERSLQSNNTAGFTAGFRDLKSINVVDSLTLRLSIPKGTAANWYDTYLGSWESSIVKPGETNFDRPVGAGPMTLAKYTPGESLSLTRSATYWDKDSILLGGVDLVGVTANDQQAAVNALAAGQVDMSPATVQLIPTLGSGNEAYIVENPNRLATFQLCKKDGPLANPNVRKAIMMAVDRDTINDALYDGTYTVAQGLWPDGHRLHNPSVNADVTFDLDQARQLLKEAGYADGFAVDAYPLQLGGMPELTQIVQQSLKDIGVTVNIQIAANYVDNFLAPQKAGFGVVTSIGSNRQKLDQWTGDGIGNACDYNDPELDELKDELLQVSDSSDEAVQLWHQIEEKAIGEDALSIPLLFAATVVGFDPSVIANPSVFPVSTQLYLPDPRVSYVKAS